MRSVSTTIAKRCLVFLLVFSAINATAQQNSAFTRYGLGEFYSNQHVISRSLGGLTAAYADGVNNNVGQSINFGNPATYSSLYVTTFDIGFTIDSRTLTMRSPLSKFSTAYFVPAYLTVGFPLSLKKGLGLSFGLKPMSNVGYSILTGSRVAGDSLNTTYEGSGGMNQVFVGIGKKWKGFSIGFNTGYNFGRKETNTIKQFVNDSTVYQQSKSGVATSYSGLFLEGGFQYDFSVHKTENKNTKTVSNYRLRLGATGNIKQNLNALQDIYRQTYVTTTSGDIKIDSVYEQNEVKGKIALPATYAAGITFHKTVSMSRGTFEMWSIGAEYTATKWTQYRFYGAPDMLSDSWLFKTGIQFCPDPTTGFGYWNNVNYRVGFNTGRDYLNPDGNGLKRTAFSFGAGLPVRKWRNYDNQFTYLNTSFEFGKRGSGANNITESYFQFSLSMSLSDKWFIKRRYE